MALTNETREGMIEDSGRSFTIAVDEYDESQLKGRIYHDGNKDTVEYHGLVEMMAAMNQTLNGGERPMMTMALRTFQGEEEPEEESEVCEDSERPVDERSDFTNTCDLSGQIPTVLKTSDEFLSMGKRATFRIFVRYRHHASLQGILFCVEKKKSMEFHSFLQMAKQMECMMNGRDSGNMSSQRLDVCRIVVDVSRHGDLVGNLQSISGDFQYRFYHTMTLANLLFDLIGGEECREKAQVQEKTKAANMVARETPSPCQKDGKKATFVVRILFRKYATWQGRIYWKEGKVSRPFRSFMEMVMLMASAIDGGKEKTGEIPLER